MRAIIHRPAIAHRGLYCTSETGFRFGLDLATACTLTWDDFSTSEMSLDMMQLWDKTKHTAETGFLFHLGVNAASVVTVPT